MNLKLEHQKEFKKIEKIAREMGKKEKNSRRYNNLDKRIKKIYYKIMRYREFRYNEKSVEALKNIKKDDKYSY